MTNEEAIKLFAANAIEITGLMAGEEDDNYAFQMQRTLDAIDMAIKALENAEKNAEKYKWHDLRKNPDDLPDRNDFYNILILTDGKAIYASANWSCLIKSWIYDSQYELKPHTVIAWREIEPFEEVEE